MLLDEPTQVWKLVCEHIRQDPTHRDEMISLLVQLGYCHVGNDYPAAALTPVQRDTLLPTLQVRAATATTTLLLLRR
jgi:hypothetical protein